MTAQPFVVFGYGSLIFKPPPHVAAQAPGFLKGYVRRFAQKSHDHRGHAGGVHLFPHELHNTYLAHSILGASSLLVHKKDWDLFSGADAFPDEDIVWGVAYTIDPASETEVRAYLDYREKDGYTMESMPIYNVVDGAEKIIIPNAYCYVGRSDNPSFLGSEPLPALAHRIWTSEYLYNLADAVRQLSPDSIDRHLFTLEELVKKLDGENIPADVGGNWSRLGERLNNFWYLLELFFPPPMIRLRPI
ncbi:ChaC-like protein [Mycena amicta]|nr:ChaC-like protein [Mycena amicta]